VHRSRRRLLLAIAVVAASCSKADAGAPSNPPPQSPPALATAGCPVRGTLEPPRALLLFRENGCVPPGRLMGFRCAPEEPIVLEVGAGTKDVERFVGDRWATPVDTLPPDAVPIGEGGDMQVYAVPGDPRMLYVGQGETVTRWLRLPRRAVHEPPTAFVIGDSIADGAAPSIVSALPGWTIGFDAVIGRGTNTALTTAAEQGVARPDVVVVELGTNDASPTAFTQNALQIMDALNGVPLVVWQTVHSPAEDVPLINETIRRVAAANPNTTIADWHSFVSDDMLVSDGVHPQSEHESAMADLVAPILKGWRDAVQGTGAAACLGGAT
jgi:lysophospholipase L1-like esterase